MTHLVVKLFLKEVGLDMDKQIRLMGQMSFSFGGDDAGW